VAVWRQWLLITSGCGRISRIRLAIDDGPNEGLAHPTSRCRRYYELELHRGHGTSLPCANCNYICI